MTILLEFYLRILFSNSSLEVFFLSLNSNDVRLRSVFYVLFIFYSHFSVNIMWESFCYQKNLCSVGMKCLYYVLSSCAPVAPLLVALRLGENLNSPINFLIIKV
mgnify:FL=1